MDNLNSVPLPSLAVKCKMCGQDIKVQYDPGCPREWIRLLAPMVCCSNCHDEREEQERRWLAERKERLNAALGKVSKMA